MAELTFDREQLHREVWEAPVTAVAKKYGLSDNGLRKVCIALNVPMPYRGYWAHVRAGRDPGKTPLPPAARRTVFYSSPPDPRKPFHEASDDVWLAERAAFDAEPRNAPVYAASPSRWAPVLVPFRDEYREAAKKIIASKAADERFNRMRNRSPPDPLYDRGSAWRSVEERGQRLIERSKPMPFRLSLGVWERALAVANALVLAAERRGYETKTDEKRERLHFVGYGVSIAWRITELLDRKTREEKGYGDHSYTCTSFVPRGMLKLTLERHYARELSFTDSRGRGLEAQLMKILAGLYHVTVLSWVDQRRNDEWVRHEAEQAQIRAEALALKEAEAARVERERRRREELLVEVKDWHRATSVRSFVDHIRGSCAGRDTPALLEWAQWAEQIADELDPTEPRLARLFQT